MDWSVYCVICKELLDDVDKAVVTLRPKGSEGLNRASKDRNDDSIQTISGQKVHVECRRLYCNPNKIYQSNLNNASADLSANEKVLRSASMAFEFKSNCLFCGSLINVAKERKKGNKYFSVTTLDFQEKLRKECMKRQDSWSSEVQRRIDSVHDLPAADAIYHQSCSVNFRTNKSIPAEYLTYEPSSKRSRIGRPECSEREQAFIKVAKFLEENDDEQLTISDLIGMMEQELASSEYNAYGHTHMKAKLEAYFSNEICITEINGKCNVVTLKSSADAILQHFHACKENDAELEKIEIIRTAAQLILTDIKSLSVQPDFYPGSAEMANSELCLDYLPSSLKLFLEEIIRKKNSNVQVASIGQAIMQAARPRVLLAPLQLGLGVQLHHHFASRLLIDSLHAHGFCCSYHEVQKFNRNAALHGGTNIPGYEGQFVQYAADNVDHDIVTIDGNDTFHGMGIVAMITPGTTSNVVIPRKNVLNDDLISAAKVEIRYQQASKEKDLGKYKKLEIDSVCDPSQNIDILWKSSLLFCKERPSWGGFLQSVLSDEYPSKSSIKFLPMLDMNSSDPVCIYSTLKFIANHSLAHGVTPIVTFDQPLWWKAMEIISAESSGSNLHEIVLRLGGFHAEMSFLGAIGQLMAGSGLQELLQQIYAPNAVKHIISGKAVSRAVRAHLLMSAALNTLLFSKALDCPLFDVVAEPENQFLSSLKSCFIQLLEKAKSWQEVIKNDVFTAVASQLEVCRDGLRSDRTACLWLQYMDMIDILQRFLKAERTGNWNLHLFSLYEMLPYLAAAGHNLYVKSLWLYLCSMRNLEVLHTDIYEKFQLGFHVVRRSSRYWAGLSSDLIIEQVLMRSLKTSGGLTRGRGMTEQQRAIWVLSMPTCAEVNSSMLDLTNVSYTTSEQNKDLMSSRQARDVKDVTTLLHYLEKHNPFAPGMPFCNIINGVGAEESVNVDNAKSIGTKILESMIDQKVSSYSFKRKSQAITLSSKSSIKVDGELICVDPQLLFQRLLVVCQLRDDIAALFKYELCSYPPALFDENLLMREPKKPALADSLWVMAGMEIATPSCECRFVLDGGALLHRVPWSKGSTFHEICSAYIHYIERRYSDAVIVFDGYGTMSVKESTQQKRAKGKSCVDIVFSAATVLTVNKDLFLSNAKNKQAFIHLLSQHLEANGRITVHASGDADRLIVTTAVESALSKAIVLVGDDTDLLVLLCYYVSLNPCKIFFKPEPKSNSKKNRTWDIKLLVEKLGVELCQCILFIHAILGCDTTSRLFGIGKGVGLKVFRNNDVFRVQADIFNNSTSSPEEIAVAGEKSIVCLYGGNANTDLDMLRYQKYCEKVSTGSKQVHPKLLPPTSAAAKYHALRVFHQIELWKGRAAVARATEYGWKLSNGKLSPILTHLPPAPDDLLRIIHCNCSCGCTSKRCSCKRHNLNCSPACGQCKGVACANCAVAEACDLLE